MNVKKVAVFIQLKFKVASIIGFSAVFGSRFKLLLTPNLVRDSWCQVCKAEHTAEQAERVIIHLPKEKSLVARENIVQETPGGWKSCFLESYIALAPPEFSFGDRVMVI